MIAVLALGGCASEHRALAAHLESCGLLSEGRLGPTTLSAIYAPDACYEQCLTESSCADLEAALCRTSVALLVECDNRCAFRCDDGGLIGVERRCDGAPQCMGGEDEEGCTHDLVCRNGTRAPGARCDGAWNCSDGSDEEGCGPTRCLDGSYWPWERCDGRRNCGDSADEMGCPSHTCADGQVITYPATSADPFCNGWAQCSDGSDERDCAQLTLMCGS